MIREWMYHRTGSSDLVTIEFVLGVGKFVEFCLANPSHMQSGGIRSPCKKCHNSRYLPPDDVQIHLCRYGFIEGYYCWRHQGESRTNTATTTSIQAETIERSSGYVDDYADMVFDAFTEHQQESESHGRSRMDEGPNPNDQRFFDLLEACDKKVWSGCKDMSLLQAVSRLLNIKAEDNLFERCFDNICAFVQDLLPKDNNMVKSFDETKKLIAGLGLLHEKIDVCERGCMLYRGVDVEGDKCKICRTDRYDLTKKGKVARKYMFYFPLKNILKWLYQSKVTALYMKCHSEHVSCRAGDMCHPCDSEAWNHFNEIHPEFASELRNVRWGLCTDGFQPFDRAGSCWPVIVTPYNLPPNMCMKEGTIFLSCLLPGGGNPKQRIDMYMQPLIEELITLWEEGVTAYDVSTKQNFNLRAALLWIISDFPANAMLLGWGTVGKTACPVCMEKTIAIRLPKEGKQSWFDVHRRFLPGDHPFRTDRKNFTRGREEHRPPPHVRSGAQVLVDLDFHGLRKVTEVGGVEQNDLVCAECGWRKRSIFWDLPYWHTNLIRHNLDFMHIEKYVFDNVFNTVLDILGKTKDNVKSREDLQLICDRRNLQRNNRTGKYPKASYQLTRPQRKLLLEWLAGVRFPDGYVSNMSRCIDKDSYKVYGLKSHDCHVFMQRLMPIAFQEFLPRRVWEVLTELSTFFKCLTSSIITFEDMTKLESNIVCIICKLETIFPPSFFDVMEHLPHLLHEARIGGPVL